MNKLIKKHLKTFMILILVILGVLVISVYVGARKIKKDGEYKAQLMEIQPGDTLVDLDGDGDDEIVRYSSLISEDSLYTVESLVAYDEIGEEVGRLPEEMPIEEPLPNTSQVFVANKEDGKQFISYEYISGPHSSMTMVFGLFELKTGQMGLLPICSTEIVKSAYDCLFWSGQVGTLVVKDLDNDGMIEIVEMVDEYPKNGEITSEIIEITNREFKDLGQDTAKSMIRVLKREQGGRGNRVVWNIYHYNGEMFKIQLGSDYEKYYGLVEKYLRKSSLEYPVVMKRSEMSQESLEYNEFLEGFWEGN